MGHSKAVVNFLDLPGVYPASKRGPHSTSPSNPITTARLVINLSSPEPNDDDAMSLKLPTGFTQLMRATALPKSHISSVTRQLHKRFLSPFQPVEHASPRIPSLLRQSTSSTRLSLASLAKTPSRPVPSLRPSRRPVSFLRSFSTTRQNSIRSTYFPRNNGGGGSGGPRRPGFFRKLTIYIDSLPSMYIVSPSTVSLSHLPG